MKRAPVGWGVLPLLGSAHVSNEDEDTSSSAEADEDGRTSYNRIVNGEDASIEEIPYQVRIDKNVLLLLSNKLYASLRNAIFVARAR